MLVMAFFGAMMCHVFFFNTSKLLKSTEDLNKTATCTKCHAWKSNLFTKTVAMNKPHVFQQKGKQQQQQQPIACITCACFKPKPI